MRNSDTRHTEHVASGGQLDAIAVGIPRAARLVARDVDLATEMRLISFLARYWRFVSLLHLCDR